MDMRLVKEGNSDFYPNRDSLIWLSCCIPKNFPGGPYFSKNEEKYSVPIKINRASLNEDRLKETFSLCGEFDSDKKEKLILEYEKRIDLVSELLLCSDIGLKKGETIELFLHELRDTRELGPRTDYITICQNDINQLVRRYNF